MTGKYQAYAEYKDSGVEWLGETPEHWFPTRLKFESSINMGQSPNSDDCNQDGYGLPFLQGNAEFGVKSPSPKQYCDIPRKVANKGDLLFSVRAPVGALNAADQQYGIGRGLCAIASYDMLASDFLWWLIPVIKSELNSVSTGSTFEAVSVEQVENVVFFRPSLNEQQQIANFLDHETAKIDTLIEKQQQLIKLLKEKRQAVISYAVTKGLNPNAPMRDSGVEWLGEVPEHWCGLPLKLLVRTRKGVAFKSDDFCDNGIRVVKASDIKQLSIRTSDVFLPEKFVGAYPKAVLVSGDIILSTVGSNPDVINSAVGQIGMVPQELAGTLLNQNTVVYDPDEKNVIREYLFFVLQMRGYRDYLDLHAHGTANQSSLSIEDMLSFQVSLPPINEQVEICNYLNTQQEKLTALEQRAQESELLLKERRTALISAAVTGKIDVRNWQAPNV